MEDDEYVLGTDVAELDRLRHQHEVWARGSRSIWRSAGIVENTEVLDLGCGPGFTTLELAQIVGPGGRVVGRDVSRRFLARLSEQARKSGTHHVSTSLGSAERYDDTVGMFDFVYVRWLLCWLANAEVAIGVSAKYLRPGGALVLQDYLDWGTTKLLPRSPAFERAIKACMDSWEKGPGVINIAAAFPQIADDLGLTLSQFAPIARLAPVGSMEWNWIGAFIHSYVPRLVELGHIQEDEVAAMMRDWAQRERDGVSYCYTPIVANAVMVKGEGARR